VPTKITLKTSLLRLVFSCLKFVRGIIGEKWGNNPRHLHATLQAIYRL
jgi:hypothetical protein